MAEENVEEAYSISSKEIVQNSWTFEQVQPQDIYPNVLMSREQNSSNETQKRLNKILWESKVITNFTCLPQLMTFLVKENSETGESNSLYIAKSNGENERLVLKRHAQVKDQQGSETYIDDMRILFTKEEDDTKLIEAIKKTFKPSYIAYHFVKDIPEGITDYVVREDLESDISTVASYENSIQIMEETGHPSQHMSEMDTPSNEYAKFKKDNPNVQYIVAQPEHYGEIEGFLAEWCVEAKNRMGKIQTGDNDRRLIRSYLGSDQVEGGLVMDGDRIIGMEFHAPHPSDPEHTSVAIIRKNLRKPLHKSYGIGAFLAIERAKHLKDQGIQKIIVGGTEINTQAIFKRKYLQNGATHTSNAYAVYDDGSFHHDTNFLRDIWAQSSEPFSLDQIPNMHDNFAYEYALVHYQHEMEGLPITPVAQILHGDILRHIALIKNGDEKKEEGLYFAGADLAVAKIYAGKNKKSVAIDDDGWYVSNEYGWDGEAFARQAIPAFKEGMQSAENIIPKEIQDLISEVQPQWFERRFGIPYSEDALNEILNRKPIVAPMDHYTNERDFVGKVMKYPPDLDRASHRMMKAWSWPSVIWYSNRDANNYPHYASRFGEQFVTDIAQETGFHEQAHLIAIDPAVQEVLKASIPNWLSEGIASYLSKPDWYVADAVVAINQEEIPDADYIADVPNRKMGRIVNGEMAYADEILLTVSLGLKLLGKSEQELAEKYTDYKSFDQVIQTGMTEVVRRVVNKAKEIQASTNPDENRLDNLKDLLTLVDPTLNDELEKQKLQRIMGQVRNKFTSYNFNEEERNIMMRKI